MIKSLTVTNYIGESVKIVLGEDQPKHGLIIKSIKGIGASEATINTSQLVTNDGSIFNSARLNNREIELDLLFTNAPNIETSRQRTYRYFPIKMEVTLLFETDNRTIYAKGRVQRNEPDIFSKEEGCNITVACADPWFYATVGQDTMFFGAEPQFEFEFEDPNSESPSLEMSSIENENQRIVYYEGESEVGVTITIHATVLTTNIIIYNVVSHESLKIDTDKLARISGKAFGAGDDIIISTVRGRKTALLLRDGVYTNIINCINKDADWFQMHKGDNLFAYTAETGSEGLQFRIENNVIYEGV